MADSLPARRTVWPTDSHDLASLTSTKMPVSVSVKNMRYVAYYRVSTEEQSRSGLGLEAQRDAVHYRLGIEPPQAPLCKNALEPPFNGARSPRPGKRLGKSQGGPTPSPITTAEILAEIVETESGRNDARPQLAEAFRLCRMYRATLIIAKLDRLSRNAAFLNAVAQSRVKFVAADFPDANEITIGVMAFVAQIEAQMISARTKAALAAAKARGTRLGRPPGTYSPDVVKKAAAASVKARQVVARERCEDFSKEIKALHKAGITSWSGIARAFNARDFGAPRGGLWSATQVRRLMQSR